MLPDVDFLTDNFCFSPFWTWHLIAFRLPWFPMRSKLCIFPRIPFTPWSLAASKVPSSSMSFTQWQWCSNDSVVGWKSQCLWHKANLGFNPTLYQSLAGFLMSDRNIIISNIRTIAKIKLNNVNQSWKARDTSLLNFYRLWTWFCPE